MSWPCPVEGCLATPFLIRGYLLSHIRCSHKWCRLFKCKIRFCDASSSSYHGYRMHLFREHVPINTMNEMPSSNQDVCEPRIRVERNLDENATPRNCKIVKMRLLVKNWGDNRVISVTEKSEILSAIKEKFEMDDGFTVKYYDLQFKEYIDIDDALVEDGGHLLLLMRDSLNERVQTVSSRQSDTTDNSSSLEPSDYYYQSSSSEPCSSISGPSTLSSDVVTNQPANNNEWISHMQNIILPSQIRQELKKCESMAVPVIPSWVRRRIINQLFHDISKYVSRLSKSDYQVICLNLVQAYPVLKDRCIRPGGSNYRSWADKLSMKFRDSRRGLTDEASQVFKKKFGRKGRPRCSDGTREKTSQRCKIARVVTDSPVSSNRPVYEDGYSMASYEKLIFSEWKKRKPDISALSDAMKRTFSRRREKILAGQKIGEILLSWPPLTDAHWILEEMKLICQSDTCKEGLLSKILKKSFSSAQTLIKWHKVPETVKCLIGDLQLDWMVGIPTLFGEKYDEFFTTDQRNPTSPYPTIHYDTKTKCWSIFVDKEVITKNVTNFHTALAVMISSYWVFNLKLSKTTYNSLIFITTYLAELPGVTITPYVRSVCQKLRD